MQKSEGKDFCCNLLLLASRHCSHCSWVEFIGNGAFCSFPSICNTVDIGVAVGAGFAY